MKRIFAVTAVLALLTMSIAAQANVFDLGTGFTNLETVSVGNVGNEADTRVMYDGTTGYGSVGYNYCIGKYEVTAKQYTDFLNSKANTDTYGLYNTQMGDPSGFFGCNIQRSGASGSYTYSVANDWANRPVNYVSYWDSLRFANWLCNGQGNGSTETGAYTLNGYTGQDGRGISRNAGVTWAVTSEDEWYKAAYYKGGGNNAGYWDYPTNSNTAPGRDMADASGNNANFSEGSYPDPASYTIGSPYYRTNAGEFQNSDSAYGTFDQGGNVQEWTETLVSDGYASRSLRGGSFYVNVGALEAAVRGGSYYYPMYESHHIGFRVSAVSEPSSIIALAGGFGSLVLLRRRRI